MTCEDVEILYLKKINPLTEYLGLMFPLNAKSLPRYAPKALLKHAVNLVGPINTVT